MKKSSYPLNNITLEEYTTSVKKRNTLRWSVTFLFLFISLIVTTLPLYLSIDPILAGIIDGVTIIIGLVIIFIVLLFPLKKRIQPIKQLKEVNKVLNEPEAQSSYYQEVPVKVAIYTIIPLLIIFGFTIVFLYPYAGILWALILVAMLICLLSMLWFFGSIEFFISNKTLLIKFGFIKETIPIHDINDIEETTIHPLKDYMGYGYRIGSDGSIGYIGSGSKGVRLLLKNNAVYVLTLPNSNEFKRSIETQR